jgi:hypothetical protein
MEQKKNIKGMNPIGTALSHEKHIGIFIICTNLHRTKSCASLMIVLSVTVSCDNCKKHVSYLGTCKMRGLQFQYHKEVLQSL